MYIDSYLLLILGVYPGRSVNWDVYRQLPTPDLRGVGGGGVYPGRSVCRDVYRQLPTPDLRGYTLAGQ